MILLCPIPILLYADSIQKQLHRRLYTILGGLALLDFAVCSILTFFGIADYIETLPIGQIILCSILIVVFIHLFIYMHGSRRKSDRLLLLGLLAAIICISIEAISVYFVTSISGLFIGIGMIILLLSISSEPSETFRIWNCTVRKLKLKKANSKQNAYLCR